MRRTAVFAIIGVVALWDVAVGAWLFASPEPWLAHGADTAWARAGADGALVMSLYRRMGAFSLHAGVVTLVWAWLGARSRRCS